MFEALNFMEPSLFEKAKIVYDDDDSFQAYKNYSLILTGITTKYQQIHNVSESSQKESEYLQVFSCLS